MLPGIVLSTHNQRGNLVVLMAACKGASRKSNLSKSAMQYRSGPQRGWAFKPDWNTCIFELTDAIAQ
jgi:hypothetical protein